MGEHVNTQLGPYGGLHVDIRQDAKTFSLLRSGHQFNRCVKITLAQLSLKTVAVELCGRFPVHADFTLMLTINAAFCGPMRPTRLT
jgi:hypothetical protein